MSSLILNGDQTPRKTLRLYSPHSAQRSIHESKARFNVAAYGRQSGKTTYGINKISKASWEKDGVYWFIEPTYSQAKVIWRRMYRAFSKSGNAIMRDYNKTDLMFRLLSGSYIFCKSGEVGNNLRIETLNGCVIDEVRQQPPELWQMVIRPMLSTTKGWADFLSTPNGYDSFYDLFNKAKEDTSGTWASFHAPSTANPLFTQEEYESAKRDMSEAQFEQEIMAQFRDIHSGRVYKNFGDHNLLDANPFSPRGADWSQYLPIVLGLDFNVTPMAWHLGQQKGNKIYWGDRIWLENSDTSEATEELISKVKGHSPGLILVGDATGKARKTAAAGETDYSIIHARLKEHGIKFQDLTPSENPLVKDRVNTMNARFKSADGVVSTFINKKLKELIKDCQRCTWKVGSDATIDKKDPERTHASDSIGYPTCVLLPLKTIGDVGGIWIQRR